MSAERSAAAVLDWCLDPQGAPPRGDLLDLERLVEPDAAARAALGRAAAVTAARLGLAGLLAARPGPTLGLEPLWLAAAVATAPHPGADALLQACPPTRALPDLIARHAVAAPALGHLSADTAEQLLLCSPLTAVLVLPPQGGEDEAILLCETLAATPAGRRLLVQTFAAAAPHAGLLAWRGRLIEALRLGTGRTDLVVDIYEAAVAHHGADWLALIRRARRILASDADSARLHLAQAAGRWWEPLRAVFRGDRGAVRERGYLEFQVYLEGIDLASVTAWLREAAAAGVAP